MTDRELLEAAAKAAGIVLLWARDDPIPMNESSGLKWNPLDDGEDALQLAVKLGMRVYIYPGQGDDFTIAATDEAKPVKGWAREDHYARPIAATKRAIVRAAAVIERDKS